MAQDEKNQPSIAPGAPSLSESLERAMKDGTIRPAFRVKMTVRGGVASQSYSLDFLAAGDGTAQCGFEDRRSGRKGETRKASLSDEEFVSLLGSLRGAVRLPEEQPRFLPDTVVGILEVWYGNTVRRLYFAADPEQAKTQGRTPPPEVLRAVKAVYDACARLTGNRSVRPWRAERK